MKKFNTKSLLLLGVLFFIMSFTSKAQTLNAPQLAFSEACASGFSNDFRVDLSYSGTPFSGSNVFTIQLSDASGDFANGRDIKTIPNADFNDNGNPFVMKNVSIQMPTDVNGTNYRIRLVTSDPVLESDPGVTPGGASSFPAYYKIPDAPDLVNKETNSIDNFGICEGDSAEIGLNITDVLDYQWYRNGMFITTTTTPTLTVSQAGTYQVRVNYGVCGSISSKTITVSVFSASEAQIAGPSTLQICSSETSTLEATVNDASYTYQWFKDSQPIGTNSYQYTTTGTADQFGQYYVRIEANGCAVNSNTVTINPKSTDSFNVVATSPLTSVTVNGTSTLSISHSGASSSTIEWFKEGSATPIPAATLATYNAIETGVYYAKVTDSSSPTCVLIKESPKFTVIAAKSLLVTIGTDVNYQECSSTEATLRLVTVRAIGTDDNEYDLTSDQADDLTYQWYKNGVIIPTVPGKPSTNNNFRVDSYTNNDSYSLEVAVNSLTATSNPLNILLTAESPELQSSSLSNALCNVDDRITLTLSETLTGFSYQWFKDSQTFEVIDSSRVEISEVGVYSVTMIGFGCEKVIGAVEIRPFDDSAVTITPSEKVTLVEGEVAIATASGADSYEWFDENDVSVSITATLEATKEGVYTLVASVGNCTIQKTIEVVPEDGVIVVPNILSPNGDGINDTWELSNRYSFSSDTQIFIYNSNGKEVYNTSDYKNNWPTEDIGNQKIFYYKIIKSDAVVKAGTISILD